MQKTYELIQSIRFRFAAIVGSSFILLPLIDHAAAVTFGMVSWNNLANAIAQPYLPIYVLFMFLWSTTYAWRLLTPVQDWVHDNPNLQYAPEDIHKRLHRFSSDFWGFYLCYVLIAPQIYYWTSVTNSALDFSLFSKLIMLQLVVAVLVGMPVYMLAMITLGKLVRHVGISVPLFRISTKLILVGRIMPLLTNLVLILYFWNRYGQIDINFLPIFASLALVSIAITMLSIVSTSSALTPVLNVLYGHTGNSQNELARLRPQSTDEIGCLTQTLSNLFQYLGDQRSHMRAIFETASEGIIVTNQQGLIISFNPTAEELFERRAVEVIGQHFSRLCQGIDLAELAHSGHADVELVITRPDNTSLPIELRVSEMQQSNMQMFTCLVADISERKQAEHKLRDAESRYRDLVETAHDLVWSIDSTGHWIYVNQASLNIYGYRPEEMLHRHLTDFSSPEYRDRDREALENMFNNRELVQYETVHLDRNGIPHQLSFNATALISNGKVTRIRGTARDITEQKIYERQLTYQAEHDALTGLYNRRYFQHELERAIALLPRQNPNCAILYIDLDQFKPINDTLGHDAGDRLLIEVSNMLTNNSRQGELLSRYGGDEFTMLLYNVNQKTVITAAENFRMLFEKYRFVDSGQSFNVHCSIGAALITPQTRSANEVLTQADHACNVAKACGRNQVVLHDPSSETEASKVAEDTGWANRVTDMIENNRLILTYQPIIDVSNHNITQYEVLIRMPSEDGEAISPGGFIPAAERFGLMHNLDNWVIENAIARLARLKQAGQSCHFAINLSSRAYDDKRLIDFIYKRLSESNVPPEWLTFEINEARVISKLSDNQRMIQELNQLGCHFALDNFGSGMQTFHTIKALQIDSVKIDGDLIRSITSNNVDLAMVNSINNIAHELKLTTVAKFVEDAATLKLVEEIGIDQAQGHYIGKPLTHLIRATEIPPTTDKQQDSSA